jgi:hypothetical protein
VTWVRCRSGSPDNPCAAKEAPLDFQIEILDRKPANLRGDAAGYAVVYPGGGRVGGYAAVSYTRASANARQCDQTTHVVLGATMAHEIGHLLLGPKAHSRRGIMSERLGCGELRLASRGELWFGQEDGQRIRAEVARRSQ